MFSRLLNDDHPTRPACLQPLLKMFGYKKGEAEGKNVSILMPQPFSGRHNGYLRSYLATGKAKILDQTKEVRAQPWRSIYWQEELHHFATIAQCNLVPCPQSQIPHKECSSTLPDVLLLPADSS